ncbi:HK97 family phage prohead protease [Alterisphingorhabdus coralli]|uniref:HK97 family phage prohead protease n=1 Tax=Alterisphingorhabdus coralli TaxID=3071408 RepID=A0AA97I144_9SPHN|nr:HK97 family phage prohead protease [Parasphingorhabdus sp. SCSIO 66989]WOE75677.1 HK97 family phage prohead protease [Parasphingorhabdus sp. SCSIO 66989]
MSARLDSPSSSEEGLGWWRSTGTAQSDSPHPAATKRLTALSLTAPPLKERGIVRFAGYAALFDRMDRGGDVIRRGAFRRTLGDGSPRPLLWQHRGAQRIGTVQHIAEDRRGLRVIATIDATSGSAAKARSMVQAGAVTGLSFGYRVRHYQIGPPRLLLDLDLVEISLVTFPMQPDARVHLLAA